MSSGYTDYKLPLRQQWMLAGFVFVLFVVMYWLYKEDQRRLRAEERKAEIAQLREQYNQDKFSVPLEKAVEGLRGGFAVCRYELQPDSHLVVEYCPDYDAYKQARPEGRMTRDDFKAYLSRTDLRAVHVFGAPKLIWQFNLPKVTVVTHKLGKTTATTLTPEQFKDEFGYPNLLECEYYELVRYYFEASRLRDPGKMLERFRLAGFTKVERRPR